MTELLFENLKERKDYFKLKNKENENQINDLNINVRAPKRIYINYSDRNLNDYSLLQLKNQNEIEKKVGQNLERISIDKKHVKSKFLMKIEHK